MIILHFHLQPQIIYELFHINFTSVVSYVKIIGPKNVTCTRKDSTAALQTSKECLMKLVRLVEFTWTHTKTGHMTFLKWCATLRTLLDVHLNSDFRSLDMSDYVINQDQPRPIYKLIAVSVSMSWLRRLHKCIKNTCFCQANGCWVDGAGQVLTFHRDCYVCSFKYVI